MRRPSAAESPSRDNALLLDVFGSIAPEPADPETFQLDYESNLPDSIVTYLRRYSLSFETVVDIEFALVTVMETGGTMEDMVSHLMTVPALKADRVKAKVISLLMWKHLHTKH